MEGRPNTVYKPDMLVQPLAHKMLYIMSDTRTTSEAMPSYTNARWTLHDFQSLHFQHCYTDTRVDVCCAEHRCTLCTYVTQRAKRVPSGGFS